MDMQAYGLLLVAISIGSVGQLLLKHGMSQRPGFRLGDFALLIRDCPVIGGFFCYGVSTLLYLKTLATLHLSIAYPTVSLGYVLVIVLSRMLLKEPVCPARWFAVFIICVGVVLVGLGSA